MGRINQVDVIIQRAEVAGISYRQAQSQPEAFAGDGAFAKNIRSVQRAFAGKNVKDGLTQVVQIAILIGQTGDFTENVTAHGDDVRIYLFHG